VTGQAVIETKSDQTPGSGNYDLNQGFWIPKGKIDVSVNDEELTASNKIFNYPNPVKNSTTIEYSLDNAAYVTLRVYDMNGNEIKVVQDGFQSAGTQRVEWNTQNDSGINVSAGSYLYELQVRSAAVAGSGSFDNFSLRNVMVVVR
jgi:flagellar hook assembly protein FlgD